MVTTIFSHAVIVELRRVPGLKFVLRTTMVGFTKQSSSVLMFFVHTSYDGVANSRRGHLPFKNDQLLEAVRFEV
jgi:hypothetical protein